MSLTPPEPRRIGFEPGFLAPTTATEPRGQFQEAEVAAFVDDRSDLSHDGLSRRATIDAARAAIAGRAS